MQMKPVPDVQKLAEAQAQAHQFEQKISRTIGNLMLDSMKKQSQIELFQLELGSLKKERDDLKREIERLKAEPKDKAS